MRRLPLVALILSLPGAAAFAERAPYTPDQLSFLRHVSESCLAPDGKTIAFVCDVTGSPELWTVSAASGWPTQLTTLDERVTNVQWSPDGHWLVFTSDTGGAEHYDLYRVAPSGGVVERLTDTKRSETQPRFAPDGRRLAFIASPGEDDMTQLFVLDLHTRKTAQLTREAVNVQVPVWSPDGKIVAVARSGDGQTGDLLLVDAATGAVAVVAPTVKDGVLWPAAFAPDGRSLLLRGRNKAGFLQLAVLPLAAAEAGKPPKPGGPPAFVGPAEWDVTEACWGKDGLYFLRDEGAAVSLGCLPSPQEERAVTLLPARGGLHFLSLDQTGGRLSLLREDVDRPADVWLLDRPAQSGEGGGPADLTGRLKQVTFSLLGGVKSKELGQGEMVTYESFDKTKISTLFVRPPVPRLGSPPPAIVYVHGGPDSQQTASFDPFLHVLAEAGFAVIAPNYRGSSGYGQAFQDLNKKDWGGGDLKDLVAAVRHFGDRGDIDPSRVGITGASYGGYLTLMALTKRPDLWSAGVELYGMSDLVIDYTLTDKSEMDWYETQMGNPRTDAALFRERSPLPYLGDLKAPLLIFQGANDTEVPRFESDLLVAALKAKQKEYEYIVYDDEGHGFSRRQNLRDYYKRTQAFFVAHLRANGRGATPEPDKAAPARR
jgi:dipeptidyl aminopeptidase/acylaminoacyl peptidase